MRHRLRALLPRLHVLPALSTILSIGQHDPDALAERVAPDSDVLVVDPSVDVLEELRANTHAPNIFFLIGCAEVLPLPDASVDEVVGPPARAEAQAELARVLRP